MLENGPCAMDSYLKGTISPRHITAETRLARRTTVLVVLAVISIIMVAVSTNTVTTPPEHHVRRKGLEMLLIWLTLQRENAGFNPVHSFDISCCKFIVYYILSSL
jgi:hypothetical protein